MTASLRGLEHGRRVMSGIGTLVLLVAGAYCSVLVGLYLAQDRLLYLPEVPSRALTASPRMVGLNHEEVYFRAADGIRLHGWYLPSDPQRAVVLFCHGNAGNISHRLDLLRIFSDLGLSVFIFDYRGYGRSEGRPSEQGTYRDGEAAWRYLTEEQGITEKDIVVFGHSLGAAIGAHVAAQYRPAALVMQSAFTSVPELAAGLYPLLPARWLSRFRYDNRELLGNVDSPVLVIHSREDEIIPYAHGERLFAVAGEPKQLLELRGGHNDGIFVSGTLYTHGLRDFLDRHLPAKSH